MRAWPPPLVDRLQQGVVSLALCLKMTRTDGQVLGFTSLDRDLDIDGVTYEASDGLRRTALALRSDASVSTQDLEGALSSDKITENDLLAGYYDGAKLETFIVDWSDLSLGTGPLSTAYLGDVTTQRGQFKTEAVSLAQKLQQTRGRVTSRDCAYDLGDSRCGVDLDPLRATGSVETVTDQRTWIDTTRSESDDWYKYGTVKWTSGNNAGLVMEIKQSTTGGVFSLWQPMPYAIQAGDGYELTPGCDKLVGTCKGKFDNFVNYGGQPHRPGVGQIRKGV